MPVNHGVPDYELDDVMELTTPAQVNAMAGQLRRTILGLLHERAASVTELATAVGRPKSTVAHHVKVLADAGLVRVVRTRRVRAVDERFYGRTARMFHAGLGESADRVRLPLDYNDFEVAAQESAEAYQNRQLQAFMRRARITAEQADEFMLRVHQLLGEFERLPRSGETTYVLTAGIYPLLGHPVLPEPD